MNNLIGARLSAKSLVIFVVSLISVMAVSTGCHRLDDMRVPSRPVFVPFATVGDWNVYGVAAALDTRRFIKAMNQPAGYAYAESSATGFGGVLLVCDFSGGYVAYDLSCPVECSPDVRIGVDADLNIGVCPKCGSTYDIFRVGNPLQGKAAEEGWALRRYKVTVSAQAMPYAVISR